MRYEILLKQFFEDGNSFCGATNAPVLDFWWHLLWVSNPWWILHLCAFTHACNRFLNLPLGWHILTAQWSPWQLSLFDPCTYRHVRRLWWGSRLFSQSIEYLLFIYLYSESVSLVTFSTVNIGSICFWLLQRENNFIKSARNFWPDTT